MLVIPPPTDNGTNISDGIYEIPHNYNPDNNKIGISINGSNFLLHHHSRVNFDYILHSNMFI